MVFSCHRHVQSTPEVTATGSISRGMHSEPKNPLHNTNLLYVNKVFDSCATHTCSHTPRVHGTDTSDRATNAAGHSSRICGKDTASLTAHPHTPAKGHGEKEHNPHMTSILRVVRKTGTTETLRCKVATVMTLAMSSCVASGRQTSYLHPKGALPVHRNEIWRFEISIWCFLSGACRRLVGTSPCTPGARQASAVRVLDAQGRENWFWTPANQY